MSFNTSNIPASRVNIMPKSRKLTPPGGPANVATAPIDFLFQRAIRELPPFSVSIVGRYVTPTGLDATEYPILITILVILTGSSPTEDQLIQAHTSFFAFGSQVLVAYFKKSIWEELPVRPWYQWAVARTSRIAPTDAILQENWDGSQMKRTIEADAHALVAKVRRYLVADPNGLERICRLQGLEMFKFKREDGHQEGNDNGGDETMMKTSVPQPRGVGAGQKRLPPLQPELAWYTSQKRTSERTKAAPERVTKRVRKEMEEGSRKQNNQYQAQAVYSRLEMDDVLHDAALLAASDTEAEFAHDVNEHAGVHIPRSKSAASPKPKSAAEEEPQPFLPKDPLPSVEGWNLAQAQILDNMEQVKDGQKHPRESSNLSNDQVPSSSAFVGIDDFPVEALDMTRNESPRTSSKSPDPVAEVVSLDSDPGNLENIKQQGSVAVTRANPLVIDDDDNNDGGGDDDELPKPNEPNPSVDNPLVAEKPLAPSPSTQGGNHEHQHAGADSAVSDNVKSSPSFVGIEDADGSAEPARCRN